MTDPAEIRRAQLRASIAERLLPVCRHWPIEMFDEMVRGLAAITARYEVQFEPLDQSKTNDLAREMKELAERSSLLRNQLSSDSATDETPPRDLESPS